MRKLDLSEINAIELTEKEQKSNAAFYTLAKVIKHYNDGWVPTPEDRGYLVYSKKLLLWGGSAAHGTLSGLGCASSLDAFSDSYSNIGARLVIRDFKLCKFMAENYEQEYKDLWMED